MARAIPIFILALTAFMSLMMGAENAQANVAPYTLPNSPLCGAHTVPPSTWYAVEYSTTSVKSVQADWRKHGGADTLCHYLDKLAFAVQQNVNGDPIEGSFTQLPLRHWRPQNKLKPGKKYGWLCYRLDPSSPDCPTVEGLRVVATLPNGANIWEPTSNEAAQKLRQLAGLASAPKTGPPSVAPSSAASQEKAVNSTTGPNADTSNPALVSALNNVATAINRAADMWSSQRSNVVGNGPPGAPLPAESGGEETSKTSESTTTIYRIVPGNQGTVATTPTQTQGEVPVHQQAANDHTAPVSIASGAALAATGRDMSQPADSTATSDSSAMVVPEIPWWKDPNFWQTLGVWMILVLLGIIAAGIWKGIRRPLEILFPDPPPESRVARPIVEPETVVAEPRTIVTPKENVVAPATASDSEEPSVRVSNRPGFEGVKMVRLTIPKGLGLPNEGEEYWTEVLARSPFMDGSDDEDIVAMPTVDLSQYKSIGQAQHFAFGSEVRHTKKRKFRDRVMSDPVSQRVLSDPEFLNRYRELRQNEPLAEAAE